MKKTIFLIVSLGFLVAGQSQFLKFGVKGGANLVKMAGQSFKDGYDLGYYAGGFVELKLGEKWFLQPEVLFGETSLTYSEDFKDIYENVLDISKLSTMKLQRLSIPLTLNYKIANIFSLTAGPQFSIIMDRGESFMKNAEQAFSNGDIGLIAGGNFHFGKFRVNGRYIWGLKDMNNIDNQDAWKAQTAQLGVGFVF
jgi:hypothetical protein